jgi:protein phosphatase
MNNSVWISTAETNIGTVRKVNEDDFYDAPQAKIWCVADGMGGHARGDVASQMITENLYELVSKKRHALSVASINECLCHVNSKLVELSKEHQSIVGSTVVVLFFDGNKAHFIWAGDSRIYRLRNNTLSRVTRDHSQVEDMVDAGLIKPEEAENHPRANVITRAVGASKHLELSVKTLDLDPSDQYFLCSDGLNKVMSDTEIEHALISMPTKSITSRLIEVALARKARDNVTVIVVRNEQAAVQSDGLHQTLPLDDTLPLNYPLG